MPDSLEQKLMVVERLTVLFKFERMVYLGVTVISLIMLLTSGVMLILEEKAGPAEMTLLFGSSGSITYTAGRLLNMWNEALKRLMPEPEIN